MIDEGIAISRGADVIVGAGAQIGAPTVAAALGVPYVYVAYTPQALWSAQHPPFLIPIHGLPRPLNRLLWSMHAGIAGAAFGGPLNRKRRALGLPPIQDFSDHFFPRGRTILAADPELAPAAPDSPLAHPATGAWHLADERPLGAELERFLEAGPPPIYIGFGSMPDQQATQTTRLLVDAARAAGARLVLSRGWAGHGAGGPFGDDVLVVGPIAHAQLFPRVAACVHHGGAGTTGAAARAGRPQIIVPHIFDQFQWARWVHAAGLGPEPIPRPRLNTARLAQALRAAADRDTRERAARLGEQIRARDSISAGIAALVRLSQIGGA
jgi:vancomycin aglycone glucosyltransferase